MQKKFIWFNVKRIKNLDELKTEYRNLAKYYHPDKVLNDPKKTLQYTENMKQINNEYEHLKQNSDLLQGNNEQTNNNFNNQQNFNSSELSDELQEVLSKIKHLEGIEIEVCGTWIWVKSEKQYKEYLKYVGFMWHSKKFLWYYKPKDQKHFKSAKQMEMDHIRDKYGSQEVKTETLNKIA